MSVTARRRAITDAESAAIRQMYKDGHTFAAIGRALGRQTMSVRNHLVYHGIHTPEKQSLSDDDRRAIAEMYARGEPMDSIRRQAECGYRIIYECLEEYGVPLRSPETTGPRKRPPARPRRCANSPVAVAVPLEEISAANVRMLLIDVLGVAVEDVHNNSYRDDALAFFRSGWYRHILTALGLPPDILPEGVRLEAA